MVEIEIVTPIVHLNGTSRRELSDQLEQVYCSLGNVVEAMKQSTPNGRDYYPVPGRMDKALAQHWRRMKLITDLQQEIESQLGKMNAECDA